MKYYFLLIAITGTITASCQEWKKQYDYVDQCVCGLSVVGKGNKHGYADKDGKLVVPLVYDEAIAFSEGMA
ncbi:MAG: WG repeat-containing protein, partial [Bacteroidota bacterium]